MKVEIFQETDDNGKVIKKYAVITDWEKEKKSEENAIKYVAGKLFKCKKDSLTTMKVYLKDPNADEMFFTKKLGCKSYIAVYKK